MSVLTVRYKNGDNYSGDIGHDLKEGQGKYRYSNGDLYEGSFHNDLPHGPGKLTTSEATYSGEFKDGLPHGSGTLEVLKPENKKSLKSYKGYWSRGKPDGLGNAEYAGGQKYEGSFVEGAKNGYGKYFFTDGTIYEGEWKDDNFHGQGKLIVNGRKYYQGQFRSGSKHGKGVMACGEDTFAGIFAHGKPQGVGSYQFKSGRVLECFFGPEPERVGKITLRGEWQYEGEHRDGTRMGKGTCVMRNGTYIGDWDRDLRKGFGKFIYVNENVYEGSWLQDQQHGQGRLFFSNKDVYEGSFEGGQIQGSGRYKFNNGDQYFGQFSKGKPHGRGTYRFSKKGEEVSGVWVDGVRQQ